MVIGVARRIDHRQRPLVPVPVGLVVVALPLFVLHDITLIVERLLGERREHPAHPVRLEVESQLHFVGRQGLEIVGAVEPGSGIERAARALDELEVPVLGHVR